MYMNVWERVASSLLLNQNVNVILNVLPEFSKRMSPNARTPPVHSNEYFSSFSFVLFLNSFTLKIDNHTKWYEQHSGVKNRNASLCLKIWRHRFVSSKYRADICHTSGDLRCTCAHRETLLSFFCCGTDSLILESINSFLKQMSKLEEFAKQVTAWASLQLFRS